MKRPALRESLTNDQGRARSGDLNPEHGVRLMRAHATFFDHHLRGGEQPTLEDPASVHPEPVMVDPWGSTGLKGPKSLCDRGIRLVESGTEAEEYGYLP